MKSHNKTQIEHALKEGFRGWKLDTGNDGYDDVLIGMRDDVETDILNYHDLGTMPEHWQLWEVFEIEEVT